MTGIHGLKHVDGGFITNFTYDMRSGRMRRAFTTNWRMVISPRLRCLPGAIPVSPHALAAIEALPLFNGYNALIRGDKTRHYI
jgi:hypothetical protein